MSSFNKSLKYFGEMSISYVVYGSSIGLHIMRHVSMYRLHDVVNNTTKYVGGTRTFVVIICWLTKLTKKTILNCLPLRNFSVH